MGRAEPETTPLHQAAVKLSQILAHDVEMSADGKVKGIRQVSAGDRSGAAADAHAAFSEGLERQCCAGEMIPQFVHQNGQALRSPVRERPLALALELGDRFGDVLVEAVVERLELIVGNLRILLDGQLGNSLADYPTVLNNLAHDEAHPQQVAAVKDGALAELSWGRRWMAEDLDKLVQLGLRQGPRRFECVPSFPRILRRKTTFGKKERAISDGRCSA